HRCPTSTSCRWSTTSSCPCCDPSAAAPPCPRELPEASGAAANRHDSPLLAPTPDAALAPLSTLGPLPTDITVALDAAYDSDTTCATLAERDLQGQIARKGTPAPIQAP